LVRKLYSNLSFLRPFVKKIFPGFFKYDTIKYWKEVEGPHYFEYWKKNFENKGIWKIQEVKFIEHLKNIEFDSVLEYGCGYGRILKLVEDTFPDVLIYGCDLSKHQIINGIKYLGNNSKCQLFTIEDITIPLGDNNFDLVYTVDVLLHQTPDLIDNVRNELYRVSKKYIVLFEGTFSDEEIKKDVEVIQNDKTCYKHNHIDFFKNKGCEIITNLLVPQIGNNILIIKKP
jgi:SAM-dependent methyltransferase